MSNTLMHYGVPMRSGRYPWGSGDNPYHHTGKKNGDRNKKIEVLQKEAARREARYNSIHPVIKRTKDMSDEELTKSIKRHNLEKTYNKIQREKTPDKLEKTKNLVDQTSNAVNRAKNMNNESMNRQRHDERMDLSKMTDQELRDRINRENLELQYNRLFNTEKSTVSRGREYVSKVLDVGGDVLAVGGSALSIALAIKALTQKG